MELQGICHKMHAGLKDPIVTDQQTCKANVEYKFVLDRAGNRPSIYFGTRSRNRMDRQYLLCFMRQ